MKCWRCSNVSLFEHCDALNTALEVILKRILAMLELSKSVKAAKKGHKTMHDLRNAVNKTCLRLQLQGRLLPLWSW